jgi:hypothetical protein
LCAIDFNQGEWLAGTEFRQYSLEGRRQVTECVDDDAADQSGAARFFYTVIRDLTQKDGITSWPAR